MNSGPAIVRTAGTGPGAIYADASQLQAAFRNGDTTAREALESCFERIFRFNEGINAIIHMEPTRARHAADECDRLQRAGKGSTASGITHYLNPKFVTVVEQGIPSPKQMRNWLGTHYRQLPSPGQMTIFDRSWYSRALIQPVMGYCTMRQYNYFMNRVNDWERDVIDEGMHLLKIYLSVSREAQDMRFRLRENSELQYWKYSSTDRMAAERWHMITYFKERMFAVTSTDYAPWIVIESDNKHQARLNVFHYILSQFEYDGKNLSLESIQPQANGHYFTDMIVDGVLFKDMDPDQVEVLERILMHE